MKKLLIAVILLTTAFAPLLADTEEWERWEDLEEYLSLFEIEVEAWYNTDTQVLNFEDDFSLDLDDMLFQFGYLMEAFEFMLIDLGIRFSEIDVDAIIYSYFECVDENVPKYEEPNIRYDIEMSRDWLVEYFDAIPRIRQEMLYELAEEQLSSLFQKSSKF
jgi:hypothetical protein